MTRRTIKTLQLLVLGLTNAAVFAVLTRGYPQLRNDQNTFWVGGPETDLLATRTILAVGIAACVALLFRKWLSGSVAVIYAVWVFVLTKNGLVRNASTEFLIWSTVAVLFDGRDRPLGIRTRVFETGLWLMFGINYLYSGITKFQSTFWRSGAAVGILLNSPIAEDSSLNHALLHSGLTPALTYFAAAAEILFFPLSFTRYGRPLAWFAMTGVHLGLAITFRLWPLSVAMLATHVRLFDPAWIRYAFWRRLLNPLNRTAK